MAAQFPAITVRQQGVDVRVVEVRDTRGDHFIGEELIKVRAEPVRIGVGMRATRGDEQFVRAVGSRTEVIAQRVMEVAEAALQTAHDVGIRLLPLRVVGQRCQPRQVIAVREVFQN